MIGIVIPQPCMGLLIGQVGEWKCSVPLTAAPSAKIKQEHCDEEICIKGKL